tara:strand:+ start:127 stop:651 length:525 start_codon:yes stop_codon:yes gene_type:complete
MAKDYLNIIERALMMGLSDKINAEVTGDVYVHGQFPSTEELKFPTLVVQQVSSGFEEKFHGDSITFGSDTTNSSGEVYGIQFQVHIIVDKETSIKIDTTGNGTPDTDYKQRRLVNWLMLNIANSIMEIDWSVYEEEELQILERHLASWRDVGYIDAVQWYGATADFNIYFLNKR